jgi:DeoR/GlpR family transcriptional regulator of sugar metabolism
VYGAETLEFLRGFRANKAFVGAGGLAANGVMDVNAAASWVKRVMMRQSDQSFVLLDHSKFDVRLLSVVAPLAAFDGIVADRAPPQGLRQALSEAGVAIHCPE